MKVIFALLSVGCLVLMVSVLFGTFDDESIDELYNQQSELNSQRRELISTIKDYQYKSDSQIQEKIEEIQPGFTEKWLKENSELNQEIQNRVLAQQDKNFKIFWLSFGGFIVFLIIAAVTGKIQSNYTGRTITQSGGGLASQSDSSVIGTAADVIMGINAVKGARDLINQKSALEGEAKRVNRQRGAPPEYDHVKKEWKKDKKD